MKSFILKKEVIISLYAHHQISEKKAETRP